MWIERKINPKELIEFLDKKRNSKKCLYCWEDDRNVTDRVFELKEFMSWYKQINWQKTYPVIPVTCKNCWNTVMINAIMANLFSNNKDGKKEK